MDSHVQPLGLLEHSHETARPFGGWDLDPVLRPIGKALLGARQVVEVVARKILFDQEVANARQRVRGHFASGLRLGAIWSDYLF